MQQLATLGRQGIDLPIIIQSCLVHAAYPWNIHWHMISQVIMANYKHIGITETHSKHIYTQVYIIVCWWEVAVSRHAAVSEPAKAIWYWLSIDWSADQELHIPTDAVAGIIIFFVAIM